MAFLKRKERKDGKYVFINYINHALHRFIPPHLATFILSLVFLFNVVRHWLEWSRKYLVGGTSAASIEIDF